MQAAAVASCLGPPSRSTTPMPADGQGGRDTDGAVSVSERLALPSVTPEPRLQAEVTWPVKWFRRMSHRERSVGVATTNAAYWEAEV